MGEIYARDLAFRCPLKRHLIKVSYSRRYSSELIQCASCQRDTRNETKLRLKKEEECQRAHFVHMLEESFQQAQDELIDEQRRSMPPPRPAQPRGEPTATKLNENQLRQVDSITRRARALSLDYS